MEIRVLPSEIADQIAAGEVVERPASVVKELVENALDADAKNITIHIKDGGRELIEVTDDGTGMSLQDAEKSIFRHATSKISSIDDLFSVSSYGFRGEALAAISSVSEFELLTKKSAENFGTLIKLSGGKNKTISSAPANQGTKITVKNLFFPTPARLKHLKNSATEFTHIYKELTGFALTYPEVSFTIHKDEELYKQFPATDQFSRIQQLFGKKSADFLTVENTALSPKISGYVIAPGFCERSKKKQFIFVNGRRIEDFRLAHAIREAYVQTAGIEKHLNPLFVVFLELDPILVDVNVHPRKLEVKFSEPSEVYGHLKAAVMETLSQSAASFGQSYRTPSYSSSTSYSAPMPSYSEKKSADFFSSQLSSPSPSFSSQNTLRDESPTPSFSNPYESEPESPTSLKLIGQVARKYIVAEAENGVYFFDQHALHERQRFEQFWNDFQEQKISGKFMQQNLLIPETIQLSIEQVFTLSEAKHRLQLKRLGFEVKLLDDEHLEVQAISKLLEGENLVEVLGDFADSFAKGSIGENFIEQLMRKKLEYKSCRGAVMFGDELQEIEMQKLLDDFLTTGWRNLCPHGRPNHWFIPFTELDQKFHR